MKQAPKPWVIGNWKMNLNAGDATDLAAGVADQADALTGVRLALAPAFPYLERVMAILQGTSISLAGQDLHEEKSGAFTGSVAGAMLHDVGATLVLVGHSERRLLLGESDELVARKIAAARLAGLTPVVCVGENLEQRDAGLAVSTVSRQVEAALTVPEWTAQGEVLVAYEPIWAIGTGRVATREQAAEIHAAIRKLLPEHSAILYGGSVNPQNTADLMAESEIQGLLIGSASLMVESFMAIARAAAPS